MSISQPAPAAGRHSRVPRRARASTAVLVGAGIVALLAAGCGRTAGRGPASAGSHPPVFQQPDAFYQPPDPLPAAGPGQLIRSQAMTAPTGYRAWRILYHSRTLADADIAVSGFVAVADGAPPSGGRPVLAYAHGVRGLARLCAPSNDTQPLQDLPGFAPLLADGAAVVATDYPGLGAPGGHPFLVGPAEARSVLDSVRAAQQLPGLGLSHDVVVFGDTQGGHAALFTGQIASEYAPELHLLGIAAEDPPTDLLAFERNAAAGPYAVEFVLEAAAGYSAAHPTADLRSVLTAQGIRDLALLQTECDDQFALDTRGQTMAAVFTENPLSTPPWSTGLTADSAWGAPTPAPIFISQGTLDQQYPEALAAAFVRRACALGDVVDYRTYPQVGHAATVTGAPDLIAWMGARIAHRSSPDTCP